MNETRTERPLPDNSCLAKAGFAVRAVVQEEMEALRMEDSMTVHWFEGSSTEMEPARVRSPGRQTPAASQHRPPLAPMGDAAAACNDEVSSNRPLHNDNDAASSSGPNSQSARDFQLLFFSDLDPSSSSFSSTFTSPDDRKNGVGMDFVRGPSPLSPSHHGSPARHVPAPDVDDFFSQPNPFATSAMDADALVAPAPGALAPAFSMPFDAVSAPAFDAGALDLDGQSQPQAFLADPSPTVAPLVPDYTLHDSAMEDLARQTPAEQDEQRLSAFARLRFDDGSYYMHTYQIILGRNVELAHKDMRRLQKAELLRQQGNPYGAAAVLNGKKIKRHSHNPRSVHSEAGGIVHLRESAMPSAYQQRRQSISRSASTRSSSHHQHRVEPSQEEPADTAPQHVLMQTMQEVPEQLDSFVLEDPSDCPLVPIHPQHITALSGVRGPKGISREHAKIYYDFEQGNFALQVMSSNGLWLDGEFQPGGATCELSHGDTISIGLVEMTFFLPDVALTEEQRARQEESGSRPMSFSFENGNGEVESEEMVDDGSASEDMSVNPMHVYHYVDRDYDSDEDAVGELDDELDDEDGPVTPEHRPKQSLKLKLENRSRVPSRKEKKKKKHKRKAIREPTPEEPPAKRHKVKVEKVRKEPPPPAPPPKEKSKVPAKAPAKAPTKTPAKEPVKVTTPKEEPVPTPAPTPISAPAKTTPSEIPTVMLKPPKTDNDDSPEDDEGTITAEMIQQHNLPEALLNYRIEKRKGPGRPPKDGVMSKRQRSQLVRMGKQIEQERATGVVPATLSLPTIKTKTPRSRKDSNAQPAEGEEDDVRETTENRDALADLGDKRPPKPTKPARTPSPEMTANDYTEEQLQRPSANYVVLIHEAISSSPNGQMNLQQIYNFIERKYPYYKFRTTTSGWQSSVRHNLGQHDAFCRGDKEGKGYNWKINPAVSIEKERRKRQPTPPQPQRQGYYPPPNGYPPPPYGQPGPPPYYPGMVPPGAPNVPPLPLEEHERRLPPSLRNSGSQQAAPHASPWAGGNSAGSPTSQRPTPYAQPPQAAPTSSAASSSSMYGMLITNPQAPYAPYTAAGQYGSPYATAGPSPYGAAPPRPSPYTMAGSPSSMPPAPSYQPPPQPQTQPQSSSQSQTPQNQPSNTPSSNRYPSSVSSHVIIQLEAFRSVYLKARTEPGEETKVDNAIQAYINPERLPLLSEDERSLLNSIQGIRTLRAEDVDGHVVLPSVNSVTQINGVSTQPTHPTDQAPLVSAASTAACTAAAIAAGDASSSALLNQGVANSSPNQVRAAPALDSSPSTLPQQFTPNMTGTINASAPLPNPLPTATAVPSGIRVQTQRPSVEPLTPVPGSPAVQSLPPAAMVKPAADTSAGAEEKPEMQARQGELQSELGMQAQTGETSKSA